MLPLRDGNRTEEWTLAYLKNDSASNKKLVINVLLSLFSYL